MSIKVGRERTRVTMICNEDLNRIATKPGKDGQKARNELTRRARCQKVDQAIARIRRTVEEDMDMRMFAETRPNS